MIPDSALKIPTVLHALLLEDTLLEEIAAFSPSG
jgi:hypothetical protein